MYEWHDGGNSWEYHFVFLGRAWDSFGACVNADLALQILCLSGQGHPVAEERGGVGRLEELKELFEKLKMKDVSGRKMWYKTQCVNGDKKGLDPW